jgi:hypothetical protein
MELKLKKMKLELKLTKLVLSGSIEWDSLITEFHSLCCSLFSCFFFWTLKFWNKSL